MTTLQFHSEYEIVKWLASRDNFDRGLAELRESLADGTIVNGRGLVQKWLSVYDDVTTGRVVESAASRPLDEPVRAAQPVPPIGAGASAGGIDAATLDALEAERTLLQRMLQEARLWAEAAQEAAARADAKSELIEAQARDARDDDRDRARGGGASAGTGLAVLALILIALMAVLLWPQLEARARALWTLLSSLAH